MTDENDFPKPDVREPVIAPAPADPADSGGAHDVDVEIELTDEAKEVDSEASRLEALPHAERIAQLGQVAKRLKIPRKDLERLVRDKHAERAEHPKIVDFPSSARVDGGGDVYQIVAGKMVFNKPTKDGPGLSIQFRRQDRVGYRTR